MTQKSGWIGLFVAVKELDEAAIDAGRIRSDLFEPRIPDPRQTDDARPPLD
jgi:hypothetical protein